MPSSVVLLYILGIVFNVYVPCPCVFVPFPVFLSRLPVCLSPCLFPCFRPLFPIPVFSSFVPYPRVSVLCPLSPCFVLCSRVSVPCPRVFPSPEPWFSPLSSVFSSLALGFPSPVPVFVPFWRVPVPCPLAPLHLVSVPCPLPVTVFPGPVFFVFVFEQALSKHIAHLFSRDPLVIFEGRIEEVDDEEEVCVDWLYNPPIIPSRAETESTLPCTPDLDNCCIVFEYFVLCIWYVPGTLFPCMSTVRQHKKYV